MPRTLCTYDFAVANTLEYQFDYHESNVSQLGVGE